MRQITETEKTQYSVIKEAIEELSFLGTPDTVNDAAEAAPAPLSFREAGDHDIPMKPLLAISHIILHIFDKIGPTMAVLRQDMFQNIQRLEMRIDSEPTKCSDVIAILKKEADERNAKDRNSCTKALLWLTRSLDFTVALLEKAATDPSQSMEEMVEESYKLTLKPWHGWISSAAYKIALKLLPDSKTFIELLSHKGQSFSSLQEEIQTLVKLLVPLLHHIHFLLNMYGVDRFKCT